MATRFAALVFPLLASYTSAQQPAESPAPKSAFVARPVSIEQAEGKFIVRIGDELFTEYRWKDAQRPYCYPVLGPGGTPMTRGYPMDPHPGEPQDHPHHCSLWFAHGSVGGYDFWAANDHAQCIHQAEILEVRSGESVGVVRVKNNWMADGRPICFEQRTLSFSECPDGRLLDFDVVLTPAGDELVIGDTKEGTLAIRTVPALALTGEGAHGHAKNSGGDRDAAVWGKRAEWVDYWGPLGERVLGVLILDHPANFAHPTWWHARDYGLLAANPFGVHDFEGRPAGTGDKHLRAGEELHLRYRFVFHEGEIDPQRAGELLQDFREKP
jgi:hypothetical protein